MVPEFVGGLFYGASVKANSARLRGLQFGLPVCQAHPTHRDCVLTRQNPPERYSAI
jgi:hypothetical protein